MKSNVIKNLNKSGRIKEIEAVHCTKVFTKSIKIISQNKIKAEILVEQVNFSP